MNGLPWQIGIVVRNLEDAKEELTRALGLDWAPTREQEAGGWTCRTCMSIQGPPRLELCEGSPGSPWDASNGSRLDHLAYFVDDLDGERQELEEQGIPVSVDGRSLGNPAFNYHQAPRSGVRLELVDRAMFEAFQAANARGK